MAIFRMILLILFVCCPFHAVADASFDNTIKKAAEQGDAWPSSV